MKPKKNIEEIRRSGRKKVARFHEKQQAKGRKQVSGFFSEQAYNELCWIRDRSGESVGQIFENLLLDTINVNIKGTTNIRP